MVSGGTVTAEQRIAELDSKSFGLREIVRIINKESNGRWTAVRVRQVLRRLRPSNQEVAQHHQDDSDATETL